MSFSIHLPKPQPYSTMMSISTKEFSAAPFSSPPPPSSSQKSGNHRRGQSTAPNVRLDVDALFKPDNFINYAAPSSGEVYRDRRLTTNFEFELKFFVCRVPTCFHVRIPKQCLTVRTPKKDVTLASSISVLH